MSLSYIKMFSEISIKDVDLVGGKNASLGEMYQNLTAKSVAIIIGFFRSSFAREKATGVAK